MNLLFLFFVAFGMSYLGSVQIGPVNSEVLRFSLRGKKREALYTGFGGSVPEIPYTLLAAYFVQQLSKWQELRLIFFWTFICVIFFMGMRLLVKRPVGISPESAKANRSPFFTGFFLASLNPQLIFYWAGILLWMGYEKLSPSEMGIFSLGAAGGAFFLQLTAVHLGNYLFQTGRTKRLKSPDRVVGILLILAGLLTIIWEHIRN